MHAELAALHAYISQSQAEANEKNVAEQCRKKEERVSQRSPRACGILDNIVAHSTIVKGCR